MAGVPAIQIAVSYRAVIEPDPETIDERGGQMSALKSLIDEFEEIVRGNPWHGHSLTEILSDISAEEAAMRVLPGIHSIGELVLHVVGWQEVFFLRLQGRLVDEPPEGDFPDRPAEWHAALSMLEESNRRLVSLLSGLANDSLNAEVVGKDYTVGFMLRGVVSHCLYHSGQISLLKKAIRSASASPRV